MTPNIKWNPPTGNRSHLERVIDWYVDFDDEWESVVLSFAIVVVTVIGVRIR